MDPVLKLIVQAKVSFLFREPEIGELVTQLKPREVDDDICMETDGKSLFYNREVIKGLSETQLMDRMRALVSFVDY